MRANLARYRGLFSLVFYVHNQMQSILRSSLQFVGEVATTYPRTWIYSFAVAGMVTAIAMYGAIGSWLGGFVGHPTEGMYLALTFYGYWFATRVEDLKVLADQQVALLEEYASLLK